MVEQWLALLKKSGSRRDGGAPASAIIMCTRLLVPQGSQGTSHEGWKKKKNNITDETKKKKQSSANNNKKTVVDYN